MHVSASPVGLWGRLSGFGVACRALAPPVKLRVSLTHCLFLGVVRWRHQSDWLSGLTVESDWLSVRVDCRIGLAVGLGHMAVIVHIRESWPARAPSVDSRPFPAHHQRPPAHSHESAVGQCCTRLSGAPASSVPTARRVPQGRPQHRRVACRLSASASARRSRSSTFCLTAMTTS